MKAVLSWLVASTRASCSALAALIGQVQKSLFLTTLFPYFHSFVPTAQQAGQAAVLDRLSLSVSLGMREQGAWTN